MPGGERKRRVRAFALLGVVLAGLLAFGLALGALAAPKPSKPRPFAVATSGHASERIELIEIERSAKASREVAFTIKPKELPDPAAGSRIEASGEVTLTTTCVDASDRCIGRPYGYSPDVGARLVLAAGERTTGGRRAVPISGRIERTCSQSRPDRNHHCPLVIEEAKLRVKRLKRLPCKPQRCRINMVVDASDNKARNGNVVVVGADRPGGEIDQGKGRLNAAVFAKGAGDGKRRRSSRPVNDRIDMGSEGSGGYEVVFSVRVRDLDRGDALIARSRMLADVGHLRYSAFMGSQLIVATRRDATKSKGMARRAISFRGSLSALNGFNCTQGRSGWATPCLTRKVGLGRVQRDVRTKKGRDKPLFVNLISRTFPKLAPAGSGDAAIVRDGFVEVRKLSR